MLRHGDKIDLLFTNVVMPSPISGRQLAEQARQMDPALPDLLTSAPPTTRSFIRGSPMPGLARIRLMLDARRRHRRRSRRR
jgi:hypothetical protein